MSHAEVKCLKKISKKNIFLLNFILEGNVETLGSVMKGLSPGESYVSNYIEISLLDSN